MSIKKSIALFLYQIGISANFISYAGLFLAFLSGLLIYQGLFYWAATSLLLSGVLDMLDGEVARVSSTAQNKFGGVLDSSLDRYGDAFVYSGILFYCFRLGAQTTALLTLSAMVGSFAISYTRARAECVMGQCRVGFWERGERLVYIVLGLVFSHLPTAMWVLGITTHCTAVYRLYYSYLYHKNISKKSISDSVKSPWVAGILFTGFGRNHPVYLIKAAVLVVIVVIFKINF